MAKIDLCNRCLFYSHQPNLVCAVHPFGVYTTCLDFRPNPAAEEEEELWSPEGYSWRDDDLVPNKRPRYTQEEKLQILDTHPFFTGICPECGQKIDKPGIKWECPACGESG